MIEVPLPGNPLRGLNSYLIRGGEGERSLLIDTGFNMDECRKALMAGLDELDVEMSDTDIFLTHMHSDHTGLMPAIAGPDTKVYLSEEDMKWLDGRYRDQMARRQAEQFIYAGFDKKSVDSMSRTHPGYRYAPSPDFHNYTNLKNGERLKAGRHELELIKVSGHTCGMMCIWIEEEKLMFTADHVLFDITPNIISWPDLPDALGCYLDNLKKIDAYPVKTALPAHRGTGDIHKRIAELLEHHKNRLQEAYDIIESRPGQTAFDIAGQMLWDINVKTWDEFPDAQRWFAVGECMSHLERLGTEGRIIKETDGMLYRYYAV